MDTGSVAAPLAEANAMMNAGIIFLKYASGFVLLTMMYIPQYGIKNCKKRPVRTAPKSAPREATTSPMLVWLPMAVAIREIIAIGVH
jgi:hypothetical protein